MVADSPDNVALLGELLQAEYRVQAATRLAAEVLPLEHIGPRLVALTEGD